MGIIGSRPNMTSNGIGQLSRGRYYCTQNIIESLRDPNYPDSRRNKPWSFFLICWTDFSLWPSHWGCPGVVLTLSTSSIAQIASMSLERNSFPYHLEFFLVCFGLPDDLIFWQTSQLWTYLFPQKWSVKALAHGLVCLPTAQMTTIDLAMDFL